MVLRHSYWLFEGGLGKELRDCGVSGDLRWGRDERIVVFVIGSLRGETEFERGVWCWSLSLSLGELQDGCARPLCPHPLSP